MVYIPENAEFILKLVKEFPYQNSYHCRPPMTSFPGMPNENVLKIDQGVLVAGKQTGVSIFVGVCSKVSIARLKANNLRHVHARIQGP